MKVTSVRSTVGLGLNLATRQHGQKKGKGSYDRSKVMAALKRQYPDSAPAAYSTFEKRYA